MRSMVQPGSQAEEVGRLILAGFVVLALPALPLGNYLSYPFTILTTWFHEMGHGLTAMLLGQSFERLLIDSNGSGAALLMISSDASPLLRAAISAGGPLAPTFFGACLIVASAHQKLWRPVLWGTAGAIFLSVILYVRSSTGIAVLPLIAVGLSLIAWKGSPGLNRFALQFLGLIGAFSLFSHSGYFFTESFVEDGQVKLTDTGKIEAALWLPHWVWASLIVLTCVGMVGASLKYALNEKRRLPKGPKLPDNVLQFRRSDRDR